MLKFSTVIKKLRKMGACDRSLNEIEYRYAELKDMKKVYQYITAQYHYREWLMGAGCNSSRYLLPMKTWTAWKNRPNMEQGAYFRKLVPFKRFMSLLGRCR